MNARIINNVEEKINIYEFNGIKLNLQLGMYTVARVKEAFEGGMTEILSSLEKDEVVFFMLSTLINEALIVKNHEEGTNYQLTTSEYVWAKTKPEKMGEAVVAIATAMGLSLGTTDTEQAEIDREISEALENEDIDEVDEKNLKAEQTTP